MITLYNMVEMYGYCLFDNIMIPFGIDKELLLNTILDTCDTKDFLYNDFNFAQLKIQTFFKRNYDTFNRLLTACNLKYNAIENYDRHETMQHSSNDDISSIASSSDNNEYFKSSFDSSNYENDTLNNSTTKSDTKNKSTRNSADINHIHGNIGVTTSQQMLESELEVRPKLNIYNIIAEQFYNEFCITVE